MRHPLPNDPHRTDQRIDSLAAGLAADVRDDRLVADAVFRAGRAALQAGVVFQIHAGTDDMNLVRGNTPARERIPFEGGIRHVRVRTLSDFERQPVDLLADDVQRAVAYERLAVLAERRIEHMRVAERRRAHDVGLRARDGARHAPRQRAPIRERREICKRHTQLSRRARGRVERPAAAAHVREAQHADTADDFLATLDAARREVTRVAERIARHDGDDVAEFRDELLGEALEEQLTSAERGMVAVHDVQDLHARAAPAAVSASRASINVESCSPVCLQSPANR